MPGGIQMELPDEFFRRVVETAMDEGEEPEARYEDQPSLGALEYGDHTEATLPGPFGYPIHRAERLEEFVPPPIMERLPLI